MSISKEVLNSLLQYLKEDDTTPNEQINTITPNDQIATVTPDDSKNINQRANPRDSMKPNLNGSTAELPIMIHVSNKHSFSPLDIRQGIYELYNENLISLFPIILSNDVNKTYNFETIFGHVIANLKSRVVDKWFAAHPKNLYNATTRSKKMLEYEGYLFYQIISAIKYFESENKFNNTYGIICTINHQPTMNIPIDLYFHDNFGRNLKFIDQYIPNYVTKLNDKQSKVTSDYYKTLSNTDNVVTKYNSYQYSIPTVLEPSQVFYTINPDFLTDINESKNVKLNFIMDLLLENLHYNTNKVLKEDNKYNYLYDLKLNNLLEQKVEIINNKVKFFVEKFIPKNLNMVNINLTEN